MFDVPKTRNFCYTMRWTPDGKFISYPDEVNGIWKPGINGGAPIQMLGLPAEKLFFFGWSRDGKQFAFGRLREDRDVVLISDFR